MDELIYHEMNTTCHDLDSHEDLARQERIRRIEQLDIRPAVTVYFDHDEE
ncbi:MAG: hypothetical protein P4N59_28700 [Negativicutes bacterium]|nr:hypothetical protein [Negativicutes bacterium]